MEKEKGTVLMKEVSIEVPIMGAKMTIKAMLPQCEELELRSGDKVYYQLPEHFYFKNSEVKGKAMSSEQVAILFYFLRDKGIIGDFTDDALAKFVHLLTGYGERYAEKNISTFHGVIDLITNKKKNHADNIAEAIRSLLQDLNALLAIAESV